MVNNSNSTHLSDPVAFLKGHGTGNDFVIIPDLANDLEISASQVRLLCDRHKGIGGDGLLRVVRTMHMPAQLLESLGISSEDSEFFMDYRNSDGSIAETCGNGIRVFAEYLIHSGHVAPGEFVIGTRAGNKTVTYISSDSISVGMGVALFESDVNAVNVSTDTGTWPATQVSIPNPHCISMVSNQADPGDLFRAPTCAPIGPFTNGANFEFLSEINDCHFAMRTFERGVGETLSCGSGATAAAATFAAIKQLKAPWRVQVDVLGGTLWIDQFADGQLVLTGPAQLVASGETDVLSLAKSSGVQ